MMWPIRDQNLITDNRKTEYRQELPGGGSCFCLLSEKKQRKYCEAEKLRIYLQLIGFLSVLTCGS